MGKFIANSSLLLNGNVGYVNIDSIVYFRSDGDRILATLTSGEVIEFASSIEQFKELLEKHGHTFASVLR